jgi:hypothetical protein
MLPSSSELNPDDTKVWRKPGLNREDRGNVSIRNVGIQPEDYMAQQLKRPQSRRFVVKTSHPTNNIFVELIYFKQ